MPDIRGVLRRRGVGKTDGVLGKWAIKEQKYGSHFKARMFRKATTTSEDAIERAKEIYLSLGAKFNETKLTFRMPLGGRVSFGFLDGIADADAKQGKNRTRCMGGGSWATCQSCSDRSPVRGAAVCARSA